MAALRVKLLLGSIEAWGCTGRFQAYSVTRPGFEPSLLASVACALYHTRPVRRYKVLLLEM